MIIPQHALENHLKKGCVPMYIVVGQDPYLFNQAVLSIKKVWQQDSEETLLDVQQAQDWSDSLHNANTYSLFSEYRLLDLRFTRKTLDVLGKKTIQEYLDNANPRCLVLVQAPELPVKQIQTLVSHPNLVCVQVTPYSPQIFRKFIVQRLHALQIKYEQDTPEVIYQYHQANLLACNQFLELLACMHDLDHTLTTQILMSYLRDQSEFSIYELGDACLSGETTHAIHICRQIRQVQGEPILLLWVLSQELRKIAQIHHLLASLSLQVACQQLKIWAQKILLYQKACHRVSMSQAHSLLKLCQNLDEQIKSNRSNQIWQDIERLVIMFSSPQLILST